MPTTIVRRADYRENARREIDNLGFILHGSLHDREFVAAETGDEIVAMGAAAQADSHRLQKFIADQMTEGVVDTLEFVDVDIEHCELLARRKMRQFMLQPVVEQSAVRQIGQRIVVR